MLVEFAKQVLAGYVTVAIAALIFFLWRIASFYEAASGKRVGHRFLLLPSALLTLGALWYLGHEVDFVGRPIGDLFLFLGGVLLFVFSSRLTRLMTGER
jgi:hypothetical protein